MPVAEERLERVKRIGWWPNKSYRAYLAEHHEEMDKVTGTVHYIASADNLTALEYFPNARRFIYQDPVLDHDAMHRALRQLEEKGLVKGIEAERVSEHESRFTFEYNGASKELRVIGGKKGDLRNKSNIPVESVDAIHESRFFHHDVRVGRKALANVLPNLKEGGIIFGGTDSLFLKASPNDIHPEPAHAGLEKRGRFFVKARHMTTGELERALGVEGEVGYRKSGTVEALRKEKQGRLSDKPGQKIDISEFVDKDGAWKPGALEEFRKRLKKR
jgi:hypothetical protein